MLPGSLVTWLTPTHRLQRRRKTVPTTGAPRHPRDPCTPALRRTVCLRPEEGAPLSLQWTPGPRWGLGSAPRVLFHRSRGGWDVQSSPGFSPALAASCSSEQPLTPMSPGAAAAAAPDAPPTGGPRPLHFGCIKKQEKQGFWDIPIHIGSGETCSPRQGTKKEAS